MKPAAPVTRTFHPDEARIEDAVGMIAGSGQFTRCGSEEEGFLVKYEVEKITVVMNKPRI